MTPSDKGRDTVREPVQMRGKEKKAAIIVTARRLFNERGYDAVTSNLIARESGVSIGTFYSYFKDKKGVFLEVARDYFDDVVAELSSAVKAVAGKEQSHAETIDHLIGAIWKSHQSDRILQREIVILSLKDDDVRALMDANDAMMDDVIRWLLELYADSTGVDDREAAVRLIRDTVHEVIHRMVLSPGRIDPERVLAQLGRMILRYVSEG
jgi:AcrR family transcriptional regulator